MMAIFGVAAAFVAILSVSGAAGLGFDQNVEGRDDAFDDDERPSYDDDEDRAGEPGFALISLGALIHFALAAKWSAARLLDRLRQRVTARVRTHGRERPPPRRIRAWSRLSRNTTRNRMARRRSPARDKAFRDDGDDAPAFRAPAPRGPAPPRRAPQKAIRAPSRIARRNFMNSPTSNFSASPKRPPAA